MRNILIILLLLLFWSCTSCNSNNPDNDKDVAADEDIFNDSDNSDIDENSDTDADVEPEEISDDDTDDDIFERPCLPVPETGDELCFYPRKSDVPCLIPEEYGVSHILSRNSKGDYNLKSVGVNGSHYFFVHDAAEVSSTVYRCNREEGKASVVLSNMPYMADNGETKWIDIENNFIVFSYMSVQSMPANRNQSCYLGKMEGDWELKRIAGFEKDCHEPQVVWPYVVYREEWPGWLHVYDIRTGEDRKLEGYKVYSFHHDGKKVYINAIIGTGNEAMNSDIFSKGPFPSGIFEVDLETFEVIPVEIFLRKSPHAPFIYGSYLIYGTRREWTLYSSDYWSRNGMAIVLYDLFNRTETILTDTMTGNNGRAFINYPYAGWVDGSEYDGSEGGWQKVINLETDEEWVLEHNKSMADPVVMKNYSVIYFAIVGGTTVDDYEGVCVTEFHDPGKVEPNETCHDSNPCTDDIYSVTLQKCTNIPNRSNCDDGDADTPVDVCTEGKCKGYQTVADTSEMMEIPAGKYYIGSYSPPADLIDPDERPWESWVSYDDSYLPLYYIDKYEVTQKGYSECVEAGICSKPVKKRSGWRSDYWGSPEYDNYPVLYVNYYEAEKYCKWRGKRLPTEFEWVKAANGGEKRWYPWGDVDPDSTNRFGNIFYSLNETKSYDTAEVGTFLLDISPFGVMDLNGNVSEWTSSNWTMNLGTDATYGDKLKVVKGGRWEENSNYSGWIAQRMAATPWTSSNTVGFRCVKD
ncbi:MAG TPA: SUMF1/EgtB/PvdO family nonheme iron enzyme [bacterium]|nr:SUMF1/EgtB/PvdO family nonheme iron enzyme [bacterium]